MPQKVQEMWTKLVRPPIPKMANDCAPTGTVPPLHEYLRHADSLRKIDSMGIFVRLQPLFFKLCCTTFRPVRVSVAPRAGFNFQHSASSESGLVVQNSPNIGPFGGYLGGWGL